MRRPAGRARRGGAAPTGAGGGAGSGRGSVLVAHPSAELYGSDRVLLESVSGLVEAGWRVLVTVPADGPLVEELGRRGAQVVHCPTPVLRKSFLSARGLGSLVRQVVSGGWQGARLLRQARPAAVYVNTLTIPLWLALARLARVPVLCHVHEAERSAAPWMRTVLAAPVLLADRVLANSRFSIDVLAASFPRLGRRARLVLNAVPGPGVAVPARADLEGGVRVLYVGRLSHRKGVDVAVAALDRLRRNGTSADLTLVGAVFPGYEWYEAELEQQVAALGLADHVHLRGFRTPVWPFVAASDVVVVPSRVDEPFGNTAVEAVLGARPVVASATSGLLEATSGLRSAQSAPAGDAAALAAAISRVVEDWPRWRAAAAEDAVLAAERHSPARYRREVAAVMDAMVTR